MKAFNCTPVYVPGTYRQGRVFYDEAIQCFAFTVVEQDGTLAAAGGAERDLQSLDQLIAASYKHIEWSVELDLARKLRTLELMRYDDLELRGLLGQVWAE